jgi:hypothetical protein
MNGRAPNGIPRGGLDAEFEVEEARKSELLWEAQLLRQSDDAAAAEKFASVAGIEERLGDLFRARGLHEKALVHRFSAASCWAQAGNFYRAILLCEELLGLPDLSPALREHVGDYAARIRARRSDWYAALPTSGAAAEA